jgi:hypothetical protein
LLYSSHLLTHTFRFVLHTSLYGLFPVLPPDCEGLPFGNRDSRIDSELEDGLAFVDWCDRLDRPLGEH